MCLHKLGKSFGAISKHLQIPSCSHPKEDPAYNRRRKRLVLNYKKYVRIDKPCILFLGGELFGCTRPTFSYLAKKEVKIFKPVNTLSMIKHGDCTVVQVIRCKRTVFNFTTNLQLLDLTNGSKRCFDINPKS